MKDTEADTVPLKRRTRLAIEGELQYAFASARQRAVPNEIDIVLLVFGGEGKEEAAIALLQLHVLDSGWNGAPDGVPDSSIDAAQNLPIRGADVPYECDLRFEKERERSGGKLDRLSGGRLAEQRQGA